MDNKLQQNVDNYKNINQDIDKIESSLKKKYDTNNNYIDFLNKIMDDSIRKFQIIIKNLDQ